MTSDIFIIGKGPAGISAALYGARAGLSVTVAGKDGGALSKADRIENYYGFPSGVTARELIENGVRQAEELGAKVVTDEVFDIAFEDGFKVKTKDAVYNARAVILAAGAARKKPAVPGILELEGKGISYCAVCDAFFHRGKDVAVLGDGGYARNEALELAAVASSVAILTNGKKPSVTFPDGIETIETPVIKFAGGKRQVTACFQDGGERNFSGVFVAFGTAQSADFAKKLGAETENGKLKVNALMETNVPGLFAAGDCTGGLLQIAKAVSDGAVAGTSAVKYVRSL